MTVDDSSGPIAHLDVRVRVSENAPFQVAFACAQEGDIVVKVTDSEGKIGTTTKSINVAAAPELP